MCSAEGWTQQEGFSFLHASFVRSFQGPHGLTHTHKPRKGVRGRRSCVLATRLFAEKRLNAVTHRSRGDTPRCEVKQEGADSPSDSTKHTDEHKGRFLASFLWRTYVCSEAPHSWDRDRVRSRQFRIKSPEEINSSRGLLTTSQVKSIHKQQTTIRQPIECDLT